MIEGMTVREDIHRLVDRLPDGRLEDVLDYLTELGEPEEPLRAEILAAVGEAREEYRGGRTISLDKIRRSHGL